MKTISGTNSRPQSNQTGSKPILRKQKNLLATGEFLSPPTDPNRSARGKGKENEVNFFDPPIHQSKPSGRNQGAADMDVESQSQLRRLLNNTGNATKNQMLMVFDHKGRPHPASTNSDNNTLAYSQSTAFGQNLTSQPSLD